MQETFQQKLFYGTLTVLAILGFIVIIYFFDEIRLWLYYTPLHTIFGEYLYFPFYLHVFHMLLLFGFLFLMYYFFLQDNERIWQRVLATIVLLIALIFFTKTIGGEIIADYSLVQSNSYSILESPVSDLEKQLKKRRSRRNTYYYFKNIELDYYQYLQMKTIDSLLDNDKTIIVYYMPKTEIMLKYEVR